MPPEREEAVSHRHPPGPRQLPIEPAQERLFRRPRRLIAHAPQNLRGRQRTAIQLARRAQRQSSQRHKGRGYHILRQDRPKRLPQRRTIRGLRTRRRRHIAHKPQLPRNLAQNNRRLPNTRLTRQNRLDLPRLNPEAPELHLRIRTPPKLQNPV